MIKKAYIQPEVKEVEIKLTTILAGSPSEQVFQDPQPGESSLSLDVVELEEQ